MKHLINAGIAIFILFAFGCSHVSNPLVGTWEMVDPSIENANSASKQSKTIKILSDTHFAFGMMREDGEVHSGGGRYIFSDSTYTEMIDYHSIPYLVGHELKFRCILKGDKWYHSGNFIIEGRRFNINEVWQRVTGSRYKKKTSTSPNKKLAFGRTNTQPWENRSLRYISIFK